MLHETLSIIRIMACDNKRRCRTRDIKMREVDKEFERIIKTVRLGKPIAKTGYNYLKVIEKHEGEHGWELHIQGLNTHGSKVIVNRGNWDEFKNWVQGYGWNYVLKPDTLEQWNNQYGKGQTR